MNVPANSTTAVDPVRYRSALGCFPTGVAIVTTTDAEGSPIGLTCNSFNSVSLDPPLVSWGLRSESKNLAIFRRSGVFAINVLAENQQDLSGRFASSRIEDKFKGVTFRQGLRGLPLVDDCVASFECTVFAEHVAGDHHLFIGKVEQLSYGREDPSLVFYRGKYMQLTKSLHELMSSGTLSPDTLDQARELMHGLVVRLACANGEQQDFDALDANLSAIEAATSRGDSTRRAQLTTDFFRVISKAAHNEVLHAIADSLTQILRYRIDMQGQVAVVEEADLRRADIVNYVKRRDAESAVRSMRLYLDEVKNPVGIKAGI